MSWQVLAKLIIADAVPLIAFARLGLLHILPQLFGEVLVTDEVFAECAGKAEFSESPIIQAAISQKQLSLYIAPNFSNFAQVIDAGEASSLALAIDLDCGVLMDDKAGRKFAQHAGIQVIGTVGVLLLAKRKGLLSHIKPSLEQLQKTGYFLATTLIEAALLTAGE